MRTLLQQVGQEPETKNPRDEEMIEKLKSQWQLLSTFYVLREVKKRFLSLCLHSFRPWYEDPGDMVWAYSVLAATQNHCKSGLSHSNQVMAGVLELPVQVLHTQWSFQHSPNNLLLRSLTRLTRLPVRLRWLSKEDRPAGAPEPTPKQHWLLLWILEKKSEGRKTRQRCGLCFSGHFLGWASNDWNNSDRSTVILCKKQATSLSKQVWNLNQILVCLKIGYLIPSNCLSSAVLGGLFSDRLPNRIVGYIL
jgi:hypothetical protein